MILAMATHLVLMALPPLAWVELRGFESLASRCELVPDWSMATVRAGQRPVEVRRSHLWPMALLYSSAVRPRLRQVRVCSSSPAAGL